VANDSRVKDAMAKQSLRVELPQELVALLGSPEAAAARAKQALVLDLLREARISQGRAAALLGLTRWDILDLMVQYEIPSGPETAEELREEVETLRRLLQKP
jgi:predicted HTH domain antitoxin